MHNILKQLVLFVTLRQLTAPSLHLASRELQKLLFPIVRLQPALVQTVPLSLRMPTRPRTAGLHEITTASLKIQGRSPRTRIRLRVRTLCVRAGRVETSIASFSRAQRNRHPMSREPRVSKNGLAQSITDCSGNRTRANKSPTVHAETPAANRARLICEQAIS